MFYIQTLQYYLLQSLLSRPPVTVLTSDKEKNNG